MQVLSEPANLDTLRAYIHRFLPLDDTHWQQLQQIVQIRSYDRNEVILAAHQVCCFVGFVLKGCFRLVKEWNGEERTYEFSVEEEFITDYYSLSTQSPCQYKIIAVEDAILAYFDAACLNALFDADMVWQKLGRLLAEDGFRYKQERLVSLLYDTPLQRYQQLLAASPSLLHRVPQHFIANYLGMTTETLSRVRRKMVQGPATGNGPRTTA